MVARVYLWQQVEQFLIDQRGMEFSVEDYAYYRGIDIPGASRHLQAYINAQRRKRSRTRWVLYRTAGTRTSNAIWRAGRRKTDARRRGRQLQSDLTCMVMDYYVPDMRRFATLSPQLEATVEHHVSALADGLLRTAQTIIDAALIGA